MPADGRISFEERQAGRRAEEKARKEEPYIARQNQRTADQKARKSEPLFERQAERDERKARKD